MIPDLRTGKVSSALVESAKRAGQANLHDSSGQIGKMHIQSQLTFFGDFDRASPAAELLAGARGGLRDGAARLTDQSRTKTLQAKRNSWSP